MDTDSRNKTRSTARTSRDQDNLPAIPQPARIQSLPVPENPESVFNQPAFPSRTKKYKFKPIDLWNALLAYAGCLTPLTDSLKKHGVDRDSFYGLLRVYPEIADLYIRVRHCKADKYGEELSKMWDDLPVNEEFYVYDKEGNKSLSSAAAHYLKVKSDNMYRLAQICETSSYIPVSKQQQEVKSMTLGVQLQGKLPDDFDVSKASPEDLISALKGRKIDG